MQTVLRKTTMRGGALVAMILLACSVVAAAERATDQPAPVVTLTQPVHFTDFKGKDLVIGPGEYRVDVVSKSELSITTTDGKDPIVLAGSSKIWSIPIVNYVPLTNEEHHILVKAPNGVAIDIVGSPTGVVTRAVVPGVLAQGARAMVPKAQGFVCTAEVVYVIG